MGSATVQSQWNKMYLFRIYLIQQKVRKNRKSKHQRCYLHLGCRFFLTIQLLYCMLKKLRKKIFCRFQNIGSYFCGRCIHFYGIFFKSIMQLQENNFSENFSLSKMFSPSKIRKKI